MHPWQQQLDSLKTEDRLVDSEERPYSHGTTTCMLLDLQP
jgi:hypothetical protein